MGFTACLYARYKSLSFGQVQQVCHSQEVSPPGLMLRPLQKPFPGSSSLGWLFLCPNYCLLRFPVGLIVVKWLV